MTLIEKDIVIAADGKLPPEFREAFGRKARVIVCLHEDEHANTRNADRLMEFAGKIQAFRHVADPVALQRGLRTPGNVSGTDEYRPAIVRDMSRILRAREGWRAAALGDLVFFQRGYDITKAEQKPGDIPVVSSSGITSYHTESQAHGPGVVIGRKGSLGTIHYVDRPYWAARHDFVEQRS